MAKNKTGFIYYSVDTNRYQDTKIKRLKREKGPAAVAIYDYILCEIYRVEGCFIRWDENAIIDVADYWGVEESEVKGIVEYCCHVGLFSAKLFEKKGILSSSSIQNRYTDWSKKAKRSNHIIPEECVIIPEESPIIQEESDIIPEECLQSKVKESKVKESKVKESKVKTTSSPEQVPAENEAEKKLQNEYADLPKTIENIFSFLKFRPTFPEPYMDYWNLFANKYGFPTIMKLNDKRKKKLKCRLASKDFSFARILFKAKESDMISSGNWFSFDWVIENEGNYLKVLEGNYDNKTVASAEQQQGLSPAAQAILTAKNKQNGTQH